MKRTGHFQFHAASKCLLLGYEQSSTNDAGATPEVTAMIARGKPASPATSTEESATALVDENPTSGASSERRSAILQVAAELFAEKSIANTTVRDIGEAAGILSGSLYHHFSSKESMVAELLTDYLSAILEDYAEVAATHNDPKERLAGLVRASLAAIDRDPFACAIFQNEHKYLATMPGLGQIANDSEKVQRYWLDAIEDGVSKGQFRKDIPPRVFYAFARDAVWFTVRWYHRGGRYSIDNLADDFMEIFMSGYATKA